MEGSGGRGPFGPGSPGYGPGGPRDDDESATRACRHGPGGAAARRRGPARLPLWSAPRHARAAAGAPEPGRAAEPCARRRPPEPRRRPRPHAPARRRRRPPQHRATAGRCPPGGWQPARRSPCRPCRASWPAGAAASGAAAARRADPSPWRSVVAHRGDRRCAAAASDVARDHRGHHPRTGRPGGHVGYGGLSSWPATASATARPSGKQIVGIRVIRDNGQPFDIGHGILREFVVKGLLFGWVGSFFLYIPTLLDYLWPLWDDQRPRPCTTWS